MCLGQEILVVFIYSTYMLPESDSLSAERLERIYTFVYILRLFAPTRWTTP